MRRLGILVAVGFLAWVQPEFVQAQTVRGQVVEAETGAPLSNAFVILLDAEGESAGAVLAGTSGSFILRVPGPGTYSLRIERIGFASTTTDPFGLEREEVLRQRIEVRVEPIRLEGITASGTGRCNMPGETGGQTAVLWEEARKALTISEWARRDRGVPYQTLRWKRIRHPLSLTIEEQDAWLNSGYGRSAFSSLSALDLASEGYVRLAGEGAYDYFGLDAATLLSDDFLETHCFTVAEPDEDHPDLIGLGFEPIPSHTPPDIVGVLWLDRASAELRHLEFSYTRHLYEIRLPVKPFGGRVAFRRLENGVWIVNDWWLRMPQFPAVRMGAARRTGPRRRDRTRERELLREAYDAGLTIWEEGGKLRFFLQPGDSDGGRTRVQGVVFDSIRSRPLVGATVFLTETRHAVQTDLRGRFILHGVPEGENGIGFIHPFADSVGRGVKTVPIDVPPSGSTYMDLILPRGTGCSTGLDPRESASLAGAVFSRDTGEPMEGVEVMVEWRNPLSTHRGRSADRRDRTVNTQDDGSFLFCDLPIETKIVVRALYLDEKEFYEVELETPGLNFREFLLDFGG